MVEAPVVREQQCFGQKTLAESQFPTEQFQHPTVELQSLSRRKGFLLQRYLIHVEHHPIRKVTRKTAGPEVQNGAL